MENGDSLYARIAELEARIAELEKKNARIAKLKKENDVYGEILALAVQANFLTFPNLQGKACIAEGEACIAVLWKKINERKMSKRDEDTDEDTEAETMEKMILEWLGAAPAEAAPSTDEDTDEDTDKQKVYVSMYTDEYPEDDGGRQLSVKTWVGEVDKSMTPKEIFEFAEEDGDWDVEFGAGGAIDDDDDDDDDVRRMCSTYLICPAAGERIEKEYDLETHKEVPIGTAKGVGQ